MRSFFAYDLVGLADSAAMPITSRVSWSRRPMRASLGEGDAYEAFGRRVVARAFPIGIDVGEFQRLAESPESRETEHHAA